MLRKDLIKKILWSSGGSGFGLCSVANMASWELSEPSKDKPDLKSVVALIGPSKKYTKEELEKIVAFAEKETAKYDKLFPHRQGANMIIFDKCEDGEWMRKKMSWTQGSFHSKTLDEAIRIMEK